MGILSDPDAGSGKWAKILIKIHRPMCFICCVGAVVWFILLGNKTFNNANYFSENALLPGLVRSDFKDDGSAKQFYNEFLEELKDKYEDQDSIPVPWLVGKMSQLNLEVYTHNFTLNYPLGKGHTFTGMNVYGILRAPRSSSIEALVLTAPYRSLNSHHKGTAAGIALMLAFAKFARPQKYWAKDIIFLITEHEQLGIQAWLEAYHGIESTPGSFASSLGMYWKGRADYSNDLGTEKCLNAGKLKGRSGSIQAAINLELHSPTIKYIEVKVEGLNGQLPNLDLVNLVHKMCAKSSVHHAYRTSYSWLTPKTDTGEWVNSLNTMVGMITTQIAGVPNGNHGLFHRFGIEAVTLEGRDASDPGPAPRVAALSGATFARLATILEGSLRSLNNLLERFHQSYFFYLMAATDRFISIGQYMPCLCLLCGALLVRALALWITTQRQHNQDDDHKEEGKKKKKDLSIDEGFNVVNIGANYLVVHLIGYFVMASPKLFSQLGATYYSLPTESGIYYSLAIQSALLVFLSPVLLRLLRQTAPNTAEVTLLLTLALIQMSCVCLAIGMYNFSLGVCLAAVYTPVVLLVSVVQRERTMLGTLSLRVKQILCILVHPLVLVTVVICCYTVFVYPDEGYEDALWRGIHASKEAITFSVVDGMIYGNWLFSVVASLILPMWTIFWQILNCPVDKSFQS